MTKLNKTGKNVTTNIRVVAAKRGETLGYSANGNLQFKKEPLSMLYELAVTTLFGKPTMYKSSDSLVEQIRQHIKLAVKDGQYDFVANLAIHARTEMNLRTIPIVMVVEFAKAISDIRAPFQAQIKTVTAKLEKAKSQKRATSSFADELKQLRVRADEYNYANLRHLVTDVIQRADQITDLYAYALEVFGGKDKVPMAIKRGVADAFNKFGHYHFAKYKNGGAVKFKDVLRIVHPVAKDAKQGLLFEQIMKDELGAAYTWETQLSANGQQTTEKKSQKEIWTELVTSGKMGYMALLRNLRNIHEAGLDAEVLRKHVTDVIADPKRVVSSKQLPYDFLEAYNVIKPLNSKMATAISKAIDASVVNIPKLGNKVWLVIDFSGSMGQDTVNEFGTGQTGPAQALTTATLLASFLLKANADADNVAVTLFGSTAKTLNGVDTNNSVLGIKKELLLHRTNGIAGSTNFSAALREYDSLGFKPDTIVVLTDGDVNSFSYGTIKNIPSKNVLKLVVNMSVAQTTPMSKNDGWYAVAGWSTSMFKWVDAIRQSASVVQALSVPYIGVPEKVRKAEAVDEDVVIM